MSLVIAILGAESTGKTTLARHLAQALNERGIAAVAVPEYLREFCDAHGRTPTQAEQHHIADEQWRRIEAAGAEGQWVIADTTPLMTAVYSEFVFGDAALYASAQARQGRCTHTLLTGLDIAWLPDGLQRDGPQVRVPVDALVRAALDRAALPYSVVYGEGPARLAAALAALRPWLPVTPAASADSAPSADRPQRLSARCRECLLPGCEHLLFAGLSTPAAAAPPRAIRSFVLRAGRMGSGQARALAELGPRFVLPYAPQAIDPQAVFGRSAPLVLEIGFGMGDATAQIAAAQPHIDFIGCEVHQPGVGALLRQIGERGLTNVRIVQHDAVEVLEHMIAPASLAGIHLFFPDPWHKTKHHKRRLVQPAFVARLVTRLAPGGYLHCATDWEPYAVQMLEVLGAEAGLVNTAAGYATKPGYRPLTKFENRGLRLGHGVWDLVFERP